MNNLPPMYNTRSKQQWEIIKERMDFGGLRVIDIGCGYGDILARCLIEGKAQWVIGLDKDPVVVTNVRKRFDRVQIEQNGLKRYLFHEFDVEKGIAHNALPVADVGICFSLLPYLSEEASTNLLLYMADNFNQSLIEAQYTSDGPGDDWWIDGDDSMDDYLSDYFISRSPIGKTLVVPRHKERTIWLCYNP